VVGAVEAVDDQWRPPLAEESLINKKKKAMTARALKRSRSDVQHETEKSVLHHSPLAMAFDFPPLTPLPLPRLGCLEVE